MLAETKITAMVLCGGAGSRMGGVDKPLQLIEKAGLVIPMLDHVIATLPVHSPLLISANRSIAEYQQRGPVIADEPAVGSGPLLGVLAGIGHAQTEWLLVCPGDMPFLEQSWHEAIRKVAEQGDEHGAAVDSVVIHDGQRLQPLLSLIRTSSAENLRAYLQTGEFSVHRWLASLRCVTVRYNDTGQFLNINTLTELQQTQD